MINGVKIPYDASIKELKKGLDGAMKDYVVCLRALARKGNWKSFDILKNELRNKDYYRRLWNSAPDLVRELS